MLCCYPAFCTFHLLPFCSLPSLASTFLICHLHWGQAFVLFNVWSPPRKTFLSLRSHCQRILALLFFKVSNRLHFLCDLDLLYRSILFCSSCLKDILEAFEPHRWESQSWAPAPICGGAAQLWGRAQRTGDCAGICPQARPQARVRAPSLWGDSDPLVCVLFLFTPS